MRCKKCDADILIDDVCDDGCVYCYGHIEPYTETFMTCFYCGFEHKSLTNGLCLNCFEKWQLLKNFEREDIIKSSWSRKK